MNIIKVFLIDRTKDVLDKSIFPIIWLNSIIGDLFFHRIDLIFNINTIFHILYNSFLLLLGTYLSGDRHLGGFI
jgi:hypothetical protein